MSRQHGFFTCNFNDNIRERGVNVDTLDSTLCWLAASALDCPFWLEATTVAKRHRARCVLGKNGSASTQHV
jgi:hypothetical protein